VVNGNKDDLTLASILVAIYTQVLNFPPDIATLFSQ
jgi:hypothetical protein